MSLKRKTGHASHHHYVEEYYSSLKWHEKLLWLVNMQILYLLNKYKWAYILGARIQIANLYNIGSNPIKLLQYLIVKSGLSHYLLTVVS